MAIASSAALLALLQSPASAHHRFWGAWNGQPDRGDHTFCFDADYAPNSTVLSRARYTMDNNDGVQAQTIVDTNEVASCTNRVDVRLQQRPVGGLVLGDTLCTSWGDAGRCDQWRVRIAYATINSIASNTGYEVRHTLCHEVGHSLGLNHYGVNDPYYTTPNDENGQQSCMRSGVWDSGDVWTRTMGPHDRSAINSNW